MPRPATWWFEESAVGEQGAGEVGECVEVFAPGVAACVRPVRPFAEVRIPRGQITARVLRRWPAVRHQHFGARPSGHIASEQCTSFGAGLAAIAVCHWRGEPVSL